MGSRLLKVSSQTVFPSCSRFVQVSLIPAVGIVRVTPLASEDEGDVSDVSFSVKGLDLGETKIVATANFGTNKVNSQPASIQVETAMRDFLRVCLQLSMRSRCFRLWKSSRGT